MSLPYPTFALPLDKVRQPKTYIQQAIDLPALPALPWGANFSKSSQLTKRSYMSTYILYMYY
ncbi:hypothetical protein MICCA_2110001 [Microcystis aeruginosa PCC 9432]|uniref:Uncharacterized protein n=1 Tax=Microcystis aeruginosa PCC 9432 TaxID=1160280 RepID=A0A822LBB0_MICAE|nr:hypothetical protein MICCA_2110001 [Microcystis aeruginosa PCC 9432]